MKGASSRQSRPVSESHETALEFGCGSVSRRDDVSEVLEHNTSKNTPETIVDVLRPLPRGRLLDAPAGSGALASILAAEGFDVVALEIDTLSYKARSIPCVAADLDRRLPFMGESFDAVTCMDGIEHLENPFHFVRECQRVLREAGHLVVSTPNVSALRSRARFFFTGFHNKFKLPLDESRPDPLHHINPITYQELRYILHVSGLELVEVRSNRVKAASWPYLTLWPLVWLATRLASRKEKDRGQRERNRAIFRQLLSPAVFLGETLILRAQKRGSVLKGRSS